MDIQGKTALVFGGTSGIGLSTCKQLAAQGAQVIAISRNPEKVDNVPDNVQLKKCDVRDRDALIQLFKEHDGFDILISTATGGDRAIGSFLKMDMDGYQASFDKLWGYANVVRFGTDHMSEKGSIVLTSGSPARKCKTGQISLSTVGAAVEALVKAVAAEIAPKRINAVSPGVIDTPMYQMAGEALETAYTNMTADHLIPRAGTADEIAQGIVFLIQNDFVTGTTVDIDGGWLLS